MKSTERIKMNHFVILSYRLRRRAEILPDSHDGGKRNDDVFLRETEERKKENEGLMWTTHLTVSRRGN